MRGRRGTGKTHAILYLAESVAADGDIPVYIDLRTVGSTGGIYTNQTLPLRERATRLLMDVLGALHESLRHYACDHSEEVDLSVLATLLDALAVEITEVRVEGQITHEIVSTQSDSNENEDDSSVSLGPDGLSARLGATSKAVSAVARSNKTEATGHLQHRLRL